MSDVLDEVTHPEVVVESQGRELVQELALKNSLKEKGVRDFDS